jgi:hypothetical protein
LHQFHASAAVPLLPAKIVHIALGQRKVAFRALIAWITPRNRADVDAISADGQLHFAIYADADVALALAGRHV